MVSSLASRYVCKFKFKSTRNVAETSFIPSPLVILQDSKSAKVNYIIEFQSVTVYFMYLLSPAWPVDAFVNSSLNPHGKEQNIHLFLRLSSFSQTPKVPKQIIEFYSWQFISFNYRVLLLTEINQTPKPHFTHSAEAKCWAILSYVFPLDSKSGKANSNIEF